MNVSVLQENLLKALTRTGRNISVKPQLPILQNVLIKTEDGQLQLTTTNLETTITVRTGAKIEKEGGVCIPSKLFTELVTSLPQEKVHLEVKEGSLLVSCRGTTASLPGIAATEFPPTPKTPSAAGIKIEKTKFIDALLSVLFSAATDEGRPLLTGVKIKRDEDGVVVAATDGYRLSVKKLSLPIKADFDLVIPARALEEVVKVGQEEKDVKELSFSETEEGQLWFRVGDTDIVTRKIDGEYPEFQRIIPTKFNTRVSADKEELMRAVKSAAIFARDNANIVKIHVDKNNVVVSANTPSVGENKVDVEAGVEGDGGDIAFNSRFLLEFLNNVSSPELLFEMTGSLNAGLFRQAKDESYLHVIMPVRVSSE